MKKIALLTAVAALALGSCAPKYNAATQKPVNELSCVQIKDELTKLASIRSEAESKSGVSKENVAWAILFWPGAVLNEMDNRDVIKKVDDRTKELSDGGRAKGCTL